MVRNLLSSEEDLVKMRRDIAWFIKKEIDVRVHNLKKRLSKIDVTDDIEHIKLEIVDLNKKLADIIDKGRKLDKTKKPKQTKDLKVQLDQHEKMCKREIKYLKSKFKQVKNEFKKFRIDFDKKINQITKNITKKFEKRRVLEIERQSRATRRQSEKIKADLKRKYHFEENDDYFKNEKDEFEKTKNKKSKKLSTSSTIKKNTNISKKVSNNRKKNRKKVFSKIIKALSDED